VLEDRDGARETRVLRRFSRVEEDGTARMLLLFDAPREVEGVALLATRDRDRHLDVSVYLPALRSELIGSDSSGATTNFLGTDFTIENLVGEILDEYRYVRRRTRDEAGVPHHQVDVFARDDDPVTARPLRRHHIRADNLYIARSDHFDALGRLVKRQTAHDLRAVDGTMWRGNMILMENLQAHHSTLLRIERRVFSRDYVPAEMFTAGWIIANHPHEVPGGSGGPDGEAGGGTDAGTDGETEARTNRERDAMREPAFRADSDSALEPGSDAGSDSGTYSATYSGTASSSPASGSRPVPTAVGLSPGALPAPGAADGKSMDEAAGATP